MAFVDAWKKCGEPTTIRNAKRQYKQHVEAREQAGAAAALQAMSLLARPTSAASAVSSSTRIGASPAAKLYQTPHQVQVPPTSPPTLLTSHPPHVLTSSPPHLLTSSAPHLLASSTSRLAGSLMKA
jgi:hypothetical protein